MIIINGKIKARFRDVQPDIQVRTTSTDDLDIELETCGRFQLTIDPTTVHSLEIFDMTKNQTVLKKNTSAIEIHSSINHVKIKPATTEQVVRIILARK